MSETLNSSQLENISDSLKTWEGSKIIKFDVIQLAKEKIPANYIEVMLEFSLVIFFMAVFFMIFHRKIKKAIEKNNSLKRYVYLYYDILFGCLVIMSGFLAAVILGLRFG